MPEEANEQKLVKVKVTDHTHSVEDAKGVYHSAGDVIEVTEHQAKSYGKLVEPASGKVTVTKAEQEAAAVEAERLAPAPKPTQPEKPSPPVKPKA